MRGLIIRSPHIDNILAGRKTWEMRSKTISIRETIALIKAGSGSVFGIANVIDCIGPLSIQERLATEDRHCVPAATWQEPQFQKYKYAWVLDKVRPLAHPVRYAHPMGAQGFVHLDAGTEAKILSEAGAALPLMQKSCIQLGRGGRLSFQAEDARRAAGPGAVETTLRWAPVREETRVAYEEAIPIKPVASQHDDRNNMEILASPQLLRGIQVPFAADGTYFHPMLRRPNAGTYTVGDKGSEVTFDSFDAALGYLRSMSVAKWRRPNNNGNWGIVSAVRWADLPM